ncbi:MAG: MOSC N-terminal beta barrel domain-containing protein [Xenococcaceae cyanobacterium MO_188.B29]|nr:MOSC N-terminal beta barrel domain-containing protein [Xenococcaceae cyanobacterium MO_188.B29]
MSSAVPFVSKLFIYPIKSLDRFEVESVTILASGALEGDREFAIFDKSDRFVNGKRNQKVHSLRSQFDLETKTVSLTRQDSQNQATFNLETERNDLENWLSNYFAIPVGVKQNLTLGFPDDTGSPGPTIISTATLEAIASWYPGLEVEEVRLRFRANIEIDGVPAFWEDRLFTKADKTVDFKIGDVQFMGVNPCKRCVVISRNPKTGEVYPNFQKTFITKRQETLPNWAERTRFNHFYRLAINTRLPSTEAGKRINLEDVLKL